MSKREPKELPPFDDNGPKVPPFIDYFERHLDEIKRVQAILETKLSDNPSILEEQFREVEAHYGRLTSILAWANSYLDLAERERVLPAGSGYTVHDSEVHLAAACARERRFRDIVNGLCEAVKTRISVCQTLIKVMREERRMGV